MHTLNIGQQGAAIAVDLTVDDQEPGDFDRLNCRFSTLLYGPKGDFNIHIEFGSLDWNNYFFLMLTLKSLINTLKLA